MPFESPDLERYVQEEARNDAKRVLGKVADLVREAFQENFDAGGRPPWVPLKGSTLFSKQQKGYDPAPLVENGSLRASAVEESNPYHIEEIKGGALEIGSKHPLAAIHNEGTKPYVIRPKNGRYLTFFNAGGQRVFATEIHHPGVPARPFISVTDSDIDHIANVCADLLVGKESG